MQGYDVTMSPPSEPKLDTEIKRLLELSDELTKLSDEQNEEGKALKDRLQSVYAMMDAFNRKPAPPDSENPNSRSEPQG